MKPVNKALFVLPDEPVEMRGAIILPVTSQKQTTGTVQASDSELASVGDRVQWNRVGGLVANSEPELLIVYERDLTGVERKGV